MKRILLFLLLWASAQATTFSIDSAQYNDGTEFLGPYNSTVTFDSNPSFALSYPVQSFCVDLNSTVSFGQQFNVDVINLSQYSGPLALEYHESGWLATMALQNTGSLTTLSAINRAIWLLTTPNGNSNPYLNTVDAQAWVTQAQVNYQSLPTNDVVLFLKDGVGQNQIEVIPEPSTYAFFGIGLLALIGFRRFK